MKNCLQLESPEDKQAYLIRLPGIHEDVTPGGTVITPNPDDNNKSFPIGRNISLIGTSVSPTSSAQQTSTAQQRELQVQQKSTQQLSTSPISAKLAAPCTPRIDISRASSSSHHEDSKDSTPENQDAIGGPLGVGFREDGALELRSSTEELDFHDATEIKPPTVKSRPASPLVFIYDTNFDRQRKDSQTSEICLLSISGRTSRLSSIGSQCSEHSRISTASHLSVMSGQSNASRSTSPHKMLLETSFCGSKTNVSELTQGVTTESKDGDVLEKVLLARKHDPREAILAEGITIETPKPLMPTKKSAQKSTKSPIPKPARQSITKPKLPSPKIETVSQQVAVPSSSTSPRPSVSNVPKISIADSSQTAQDVNYVTDDGKPLTPGQIIKSQCGVEYTFIPLKGPLPKDLHKPSSAPIQRRKSREPVANQQMRQTKSAKPIVPIRQKDQQERPEYIRIKLKPDHMYGDNYDLDKITTEKPTTLSLRKFDDTTKTSSSVLSQSPIIYQEKSPIIHQDESPLIHKEISSRRSSLFKSRETISPVEFSTPTQKQKTSMFTTKKRSRSKSRERDWSPAALSSNESIDNNKMHKQRSSVFSIFKSKKTPTKSKPSSTRSSSENLQYDGITNVEFTFDNAPRGKYHEQLLEGDSIRIPLHSPSEYENRNLANSFNNNTSVDKQSDEASSRPQTPTERHVLKHNTSTSSENVVFSTKLGSNEEIFTTKLPKKPITIEKDPNFILDNEKPKLKSPLDEIKIEQIPSKIVDTTTEIVEELPKPIKSTSKEFKAQVTTIELKEISPKTEHITTEKTKTEVNLSPKIDDSIKKRHSDISNPTTANEETSENSENDSEIEFINKKTAGVKISDKKQKISEPVSEEPDDHERKTLVFQTDSFEDELPYVPTTLPQERSVAVPIVPIKQRSMIEMKMRPIERPRSTTPINPSCIDDYCGDVTRQIRRNVDKKLKISLPREDTFEKVQKLKSPRKGTNPKAWQEFAVKGISSHPTVQHQTPTDSGDDVPPPPLPPRGAPKEQIKQWINFEEIPEKHKPPKRIQTIPSRGHIEVPEASSSTVSETVIYNYVNPEDCQCECHEVALKSQQQPSGDDTTIPGDDIPPEEVEPLLQDDDSSDDTMKQPLQTSSQKSKR